ncbi:MAG: hypothetical protein ACHREM_23410 [Polyangiales bacterium]
MLMIPPSMRRRFKRLTLTVIALGCGLFAGRSNSLISSAFADSTAGESAGAECVVSGRGLLEKGVQIFATADGTLAYAGFSSQEVPVEVSDFPADPTAGRARVKTTGGFRIEGWIDPLKVPLSAKHDVPVVADHVWIGRGETLKLKGASAGKLVVEATIVSTQQRLRGKASCSFFAIGPVPLGDVEHTSSGKSYVLKRTSLDLFAESGDTSSIYTLEIPVAETGLLLHATETRGAYLHVTHQGPIVVDAWAKSADLKLFPKGEMLDTVSATSMITMLPAKLKVDGATKELKASKDTQIKLGPSDTAKSIGTIIGGADVIVIDTIGGWSRVYPKGLEIVPPEGRDFWVKATDLGM